MVFQAFKEERDWRAIAESLRINPRTAYHWLKNSSNMNRPVTKGKQSQYIHNLFTARLHWGTFNWIDETNFNFFCRRNEGRAKTVTRAAVVLPVSKGLYLHCIGAITSRQLVKLTEEWIPQLMDVCVQKGITLPAIFINNAPAHSRSEQVVDIEEIATRNNVEILGLGHYTYLLKPHRATLVQLQELCERKLKLCGASLDDMTLTEMRMQALE